MAIRSSIVRHLRMGWKSIGRLRSGSLCAGRMWLVLYVQPRQAAAQSDRYGVRSAGACPANRTRMEPGSRCSRMRRALDLSGPGRTWSAQPTGGKHHQVRDRATDDAGPTDGWPARAAASRRSELSRTCHHVAHQSGAGTTVFLAAFWRGRHSTAAGCCIGGKQVLATVPPSLPCVVTIAAANVAIAAHRGAVHRMHQRARPRAPVSQLAAQLVPWSGALMVGGTCRQLTHGAPCN